MIQLIQTAETASASLPAVRACLVAAMAGLTYDLREP
jgi:hypothetical protein